MKITNIITICLLTTSAIAMDFTNPGNKPNKNRKLTAHAAPITAVQQREEEFRAEYNAFMQGTRNGTITPTPQMYLKYFNKMYEDTFNEEMVDIKKPQKIFIHNLLDHQLEKI